MENSEFKWKHDKSVVGSLEVKSQPLMDLRAPFKEKFVSHAEQHFGVCLRLWKELGLKKSFVEACESIAPEIKCCGLATDQEATIRNMVPILNKGWAKSVNEKIQEKGYKIDCYAWSWSNATGSSETVVLLVRFHNLGDIKK